jgi:hypothetical protein
MLRKMRLTPTRDEIEYHRWSVIRWISHCVSWNKSFPAEGYRMQRISIQGCHVFSWWFCQLETIDKDDIQSRSMEYWEQSLNCLVELKGTHRYKNCPVLRIMPKMRNEGLSEADRKILNSRVIDRNKVKMPRWRIPASLHSIMPNDAASISMCSDRISKHHTDCTPDNDNIPKSAIVIKSKALWGKVRCLSHLNRKVFFEKCSEAEVTVEVNILIRFYALVPGGTWW